MHLLRTIWQNPLLRGQATILWKHTTAFSRSVEIAFTGGAGSYSGSLSRGWGGVEEEKGGQLRMVW